MVRALGGDYVPWSVFFAILTGVACPLEEPRQLARMPSEVGQPKVAHEYLALLYHLPRSKCFTYTLSCGHRKAGKY